MAGIEEHRRDVDGRDGCGGSPKTPAARYGHTGQVRPQGARRAAPRFHPGRSGRTCPVRGSPKPPPDVGKLHSRRCWICILGAHTDTRHWIVHCVQPTPASIPPPVIRRLVSESSGQRWWCRPPTRSGLASTTVLADGCRRWVSVRRGGVLGTPDGTCPSEFRRRWLAPPIRPVCG